MKLRTLLLSGVSALFAGTFFPSLAMSQVLINCARPLFFGEQISCDKANGRYIIEPDSTPTVDSGCLVAIRPPQSAQCRISSGGIPPVNDVRISFPSTAPEDLAGPGAGLQLQRFRMQEEGQPGEVTQLTFTPTEITNTVTVNFGARLHFVNGQTLGVYTGNIQITAEELP